MHRLVRFDWSAAELVLNCSGQLVHRSSDECVAAGEFHSFKTRQGYPRELALSSMMFADPQTLHVWGGQSEALNRSLVFPEIERRHLNSNVESTL